MEQFRKLAATLGVTVSDDQLGDLLAAAETANGGGPITLDPGESYAGTLRVMGGPQPERLRLEWISAAEGQKWARVMREMEDKLATVTMEEIEHTMKVLAEEEEKE